jgi:hypothetical protein
MKACVLVGLVVTLVQFIVLVPALPTWSCAPKPKSSSQVDDCLVDGATPRLGCHEPWCLADDSPGALAQPEELDEGVARQINVAWGDEN